MPKITRTLGSGMTERGVVEFDRSQPEDVQALVRAAIATFERSSFERLSRRLTALASAILDAADLPSDPRKEYLFSPVAGWAVVEEDMDLGPELADARLPLDTTVMFCGCAPDSPEGYAVRVLMLLKRATEQLQAGSPDEALASAFAAGELVTEAAMKGVFEKDFLTGEKVREGGRQMQARRYGSQEEKTARRARYLEAFDLAIKHGFGRMEAYRSVAKVLRVSEVTIRRAVAQRDGRP